MQTIGQYLKLQRCLRNVELTELSEQTKIAVNWLEMMERDGWDNLPGKAYAKSFTKAYASALGLDVDDVILRFDESVRSPTDK